MDEQLQKSESPEQKSAPSTLDNAIEWVESVASALIIIVIIFVFLGRQATVEGYSMENTFYDQDKVLVNNSFYEPQKGQVIALYSGNLDKPLIKRVVAVAGDTIDVDYDANVVYVNGEATQEAYIKEPMRYPPGNYAMTALPVTVPEGMVFVMGDNRNHSEDSRYQEVGLINEDTIIGKVILRFYPFDQLKLF